MLATHAPFAAFFLLSISCFFIWIIETSLRRRIRNRLADDRNLKSYYPTVCCILEISARDSVSALVVRRATFQVQSFPFSIFTTSAAKVSDDGFVRFKHTWKLVPQCAMASNRRVLNINNKFRN